MKQLSVSKEVYCGPCQEYPGFEREVNLLNGTVVLIHVTDSFSDVAGGSFSKEYATNLEALDSLGPYIYRLRAQEPPAKAAARLIAEASVYPASAPEEAWRKLQMDYEARLVYLPDNGKGYRYR